MIELIPICLLGFIMFVFIGLIVILCILTP